MFDLEKLQNNAQEVGEQFAHLVTFNNTYGFNGKNARISWPDRFQKIEALGKNIKIMFNEKTITLSFKYTPTASTIALISQLIAEVKKNKSIFGIFKKSHENIKIQFFPKNDTDGELIIWNNIKLIKLENKITTFDSHDTSIETLLTYSFSNIDFKYLSPVVNEINKSVERSRQTYAEFCLKKCLDDAKEHKIFYEENVLPKAHKGANLMEEGYKFAKFPGMDDFAYIVKDEKEDVVNTSEKNETINEEICKTNEPEESNHESTEQK